MLKMRPNKEAGRFNPPTKKKPNHNTSLDANKKPWLRSKFSLHHLVSGGFRGGADESEPWRFSSTDSLSDIESPS